jgi:hypothetical protein
MVSTYINFPMNLLSPGRFVFSLIFFLMFFIQVNVDAIEYFSDRLHANGYLQLKITDAGTGEPVACRVQLIKDRLPFIPTSSDIISIMYGVWDHADAYTLQPDGSVYIDGHLNLHLPPGMYEIHVSKGLEYIDQVSKVNIEANATRAENISMRRWVNMSGRNWYSADTHIHIRRSPREDSLLLKWTEAEGIHAGVLLRMGDFWATYYDQYAWGDSGVYQRNDHFLASGQEDPRTPELGHALGIGAADKVRFRDEYYLYDRVFDKIHSLGGVTGYAHQAMSFHGYRGLILDALRKKVDVLEILQYCMGEDPLIVQHYYHLLDLGIPITAIAGSDFPWCGKDHASNSPEHSARIGNVRFYTYVDKVFNHKNWLAGLKMGRTFVTSGPIIDFQINGSLPGSTINLGKGSTVRIHATASGHAVSVPLQKLEIVSHGKVIGSGVAGDRGQSTSEINLNFEIQVEHGTWIAARAYGGKGQVAHTTPVYITMDGQGFYNPLTVEHFLRLSENYLQEINAELAKKNDNPEFQSWRYKKPLLKKIAEAEEIIVQIKSRIK